jgi:hypothetical protein
LRHLGFITDTVQMKYLYPKEKEAVVEGMLEQFIGWGRAGIAVPAGGWASQDMHRSHGGIVNVMSRAGQHMLGRAVEEEGWGAEVQCTADCLRELLFLRQHLASYNGQLIGDWSVRSRVVGRQEAEAEVAKVVSSRGQEQELKGEAAYGLGIDGRIKLVKETGFAEDRGRKDPVLAELKAVQGWLCAQRQALQQSRGGRVVWRTKSFAVVQYLKRGAKMAEVQKEVVRVKFLEKELGVRVSGVWEPADVSTAELCQRLSRSTDEWGVEREELTKLFGKWEFLPEVD